MDLADLTELTQRRVLYEMVWDADFARRVYPVTTPADFGRRSGLAVLLEEHDRSPEAAAGDATERVQCVLGRLVNAGVACASYQREVAVWRAEGGAGGMPPRPPVADESRWFMVTAAARGLTDGSTWDVVAPTDDLLDVDVAGALSYVQAVSPVRAVSTRWRDGVAVRVHGGVGHRLLEPLFCSSRPDPGDPYLD